MDAQARATFRVFSQWCSLAHTVVCRPAPIRNRSPSLHDRPPWLPISLSCERLVFIAGELGRDKLNKRLADAGITDEEFEQLFSRLDTNQDGKVRA